MILSTLYMTSRLFVWMWGVNENTLWWFSVSISLVMTLRGLYLEPELAPAPFFPHDCKILPTFGTMTRGCALEGECCCVSGCALSGCSSMNNWAEECKWSLRMAAWGRNPTLVTIWNAWCASQCGYGVLHFMHSKSKSYIYPISPVLSCLFPPPHLSLCLAPSLFEKKNKKKITRGQRHKQPYLLELKAVHNWVAEYRGDISGLNQNNGFQVYSFIKGKSSWVSITGFSGDAGWA